MSNYFLNRYTAIAIAARTALFLKTILVSFVFPSAADRYIELLVFCYFPAVYLFSTLLNLKGEGGMFAAVIYGIPLGILLYGLGFGVVATFLRKRFTAWRR